MTEKVAGLRLGNNILRKKQGKVAYITPKWWDPFPNPAYVEASVHQAAFFFI